MSAQSETARANANRVRIARARVKEAVRDGRMSVGDALRAPCCATMRLADLLRLHPGLRRTARGYAGGVETRVLTLLKAWQITPYREIGDLTDRQRALVGERCP